MTDVYLKIVRQELQKLNVDAFICGSGDAHNSEYTRERDKLRQFISGFDGSAGTALILKDQAMLWTDGRYFLQASQQLSSEWTLMKSGMPDVLEVDAWILENLPENSTVGVDSSLISTNSAFKLEELLKSKNILLKPIIYNPVDAVWEQSGLKPPPILNQVFIHPIEYAGKSNEDKISDVKHYLMKNKAFAIVLAALDEIAWLLNIRGSDIDFNPVVVSYLVVTVQKSYFFVDKSKVTDELRNYLNPETIEMLDYTSIEEFLVELSKLENIVLVDTNQVNWKLTLALGKSFKKTTSPVTLPKAIKNPCEIEGFKQSHIRDGVALTAFLGWLENEIRSSPNEVSSLTEYQVSLKLEEFRRRMPLHISPSFDTIAGYGKNGAIIHYKPNEYSSSYLGKDSLFLLDSGAQYLDGTTDCTRTICFGEVSDRMKDCFTLVLKGHIALAQAVFPELTLGSRLDSIARVPLWSAGLDYNHGTGHGVGAFLNVHEGPQGIGFRRRDNEIGFHIGMNISNEPGYYEDGNFGIRIENILNTIESKTPNNFQQQKYCEFENYTVVPIKTSLINISLLSDKEISYLNEYHSQVREKLSGPMKTYFPEALEYLYAETEAISK